MVGTPFHSEVLFVVLFGGNILSTEGMPCSSSFPPDLGHSTECHLWAGVSVLAGWHRAPWSFDTVQDTGIDQIGILGDSSVGQESRYEQGGERIKAHNAQ